METDDGPPATTNMADDDDEDAQPEILLPCAVCGRKFNPRSLDKHVKICERTATKKRKPFDSAKQRIQGTELAEFLPKQPTQQQQQQSQQHQQSSLSSTSHNHYQHHYNNNHHHHHNYNHQQQQQYQSQSDSRRSGTSGSTSQQLQDERRRPSQAWKQSRDEFLRAIRAARGDGHHKPSQRTTQSQSHGSQSSQSSSLQSSVQRPSTLSLVTTTGIPMRSNEKGQCPTCQRQFGLKSYERHVAFCRERATRLPASPQTSNNVAKERLEARIKYRAPALRNRKPTNREKYSPGGGGGNGVNRTAQSPLLARSPMKDSNTSISAPNTSTAANTGVTTTPTSKNNYDTTTTTAATTVSPKLPILSKRPGQANKDSTVAPSGPLKSRPMDRSNRQSDLHEPSTNPSALKQLFASRRLLLLSDVLPSKILHSKVLAASNSSPKSSARLQVPQFFKKSLHSSPEPSENLEEIENELRKKIKLKSRVRRRACSSERTESAAESEVAENEGDFVTWRQIREDARQDREMECIDKEEEPVLSDIPGVSSVEEGGNSTTDEFEFNERMVSKLDADDYRIDNKGEENVRSDDSALNQTYVVVEDAMRLDNLSMENEGLFENGDNDASGNNEKCDSDNEKDVSSGSMKTFNKESRTNNCVEFVDSLDSCIYRRNGLITESNELHSNNNNNDSTDDDTETLKSYKIRDDGSEFIDDDDRDNMMQISLSMKMEEPPPTRSVKWHSMPNIANLKTTSQAAQAYENSLMKSKNEKLHGTLNHRSGRKRNKAIELESSITTTRANEETTTCMEAYATTAAPRCATYVIQKSSSNSSRWNHLQQHHQQASADTSSDEKPKKKRRKLQQRRHQSSLDNPTSDYEQRCESETTSRAYYPHTLPSLSDVSSVRTDEQLVLIEEDGDEDDNAEDTESNASELLKEMDRALTKSNLRAMTGSQDSLLDLVTRMRRVDLTNDRPRTDVRTQRRIGHSRSDGLYERNDELSVSTIELAEISNRGFETIARLESRERQDRTFLPSIFDNRRSDWRERGEPRRERRMRPRRGSRGDLETPREDEEGNESARLSMTVCARRNQERRRSFERLPRCDWNSYARRHPDFSMILRGRIGASKDYDPFLLAEQQLNDLFSDTSDQSSTDGSSICPPPKPNSSPNFPVSHSSAFVKYPNSPKPTARQSTQSSVPSTDSRQQPQQQQQSQQSQQSQPQNRRMSVIAPPLAFDDLTSSDLSSDCTETHSLSREPLSSSSASASLQGPRELGRRLIIDQSQALGGGEFAPEPTPQLTSTPKQQSLQSQLQSSLHPNGTVRPGAARSNSLRVAPRPPERKLLSSSSSAGSDFARKPCTTPGTKLSNRQASAPAPIPTQQRSINGYKPANGITTGNSSSLSLSSIISDVELKRSNSLFDELLSSFEEDGLDSGSTLPSLMSLMRNESGLSILSSSTGQQASTPSQQNGLNGGHQVRGSNNGRINCSDDDAELSSPESVKRQECGKLSADSAYSSLNRKYLHNGRSNNDINGSCKYKMSKFCHECGFKFPDSAKFCCECGVKRLTL